MATIRQVAKAAGVSPMTVSFVLNNKQGQVGEETRDRVLRIVRELDYRPHAVKHAVEHRKNFTLGMVAGVPGDSMMRPGYYGAVINGVLCAADDMGHSVTLFPNSLLHTDARRSIRVYCDGRCDGLMVLAPSKGSKLVAALHERGVPFLLIGDSGDEDVSCVDVDNTGQARVAVEYLIAQGHRRIAFVGGPDFVRSSEQRQEGYRQALAAHGIPLDPRLEITDNIFNNRLIRRVQDLVTKPSTLPTAIFAWNDGASLPVMHTVQGCGLRIPQDISIIGFDDDVDTDKADPPLTTMRQPYLTIGRHAVEMLLAQIRRTAPSPQREFLPTEMVIRDSVCGPPPAMSVESPKNPPRKRAGKQAAGGEPDGQ